jgi:nucleotide-binding universal stress UspA family protein
VIVVPPAPEATEPDSEAAEQEPGGEATEPGPVVVAVDGSEFTQRTLRFAFDEAARRKCALIAVHVWCLPEFGGLTDDTVWSHDLNLAREQMREVAERVLAESLAGWRADYPQVRVERRIVHHDRPAKVILEIGTQAGASLIVVGSRGRGGFVGPMLGSVSQAVLAHAGLPVAVVHKESAMVSARSATAGR